MRRFQNISSTRPRVCGVTRIMFPLLNKDHLTTSENDIASYLSNRRTNRGRQKKNKKTINGISWTDIIHSFLFLMHPFVLRTIGWLKVLFQLASIFPPHFSSLCTHSLTQSEASCTVLGCSNERPPQCSFGERMDIIASNSGYMI